MRSYIGFPPINEDNNNNRNINNNNNNSVLISLLLFRYCSFLIILWQFEMKQRRPCVDSISQMSTDSLASSESREPVYVTASDIRKRLSDVVMAPTKKFEVSLRINNLACLACLIMHSIKSMGGLYKNFSLSDCMYWTQLTEVARLLPRSIILPPSVHGKYANSSCSVTTLWLQRLLASPSAFIQAWDWHCNIKNSGRAWSMYLGIV